MDGLESFLLIALSLEVSKVNNNFRLDGNRIAKKGKNKKSYARKILKVIL